MEMAMESIIKVRSQDGMSFFSSQVSIPEMDACVTDLSTEQSV